MKKYILNGFLLTVPPLLWNIWLTDKLPPAYQPETFTKNIPAYILYAENIFRIAFMAVAYFMPLGFRQPIQKAGMGIYTCGMLLYFAAWIPLIFMPDSAWSQSYLGFAAPAYTPLLWLAGIACVGENRSQIIPRWNGLRVIFAVLSVLFLGVHNYHAWLVFNRL